MDSQNTEQNIKPIYEEFQGYLAQAPMPDNGAYLYNSILGEKFNQTIDELNQITGEDYSKFKVNITQDTSGSHFSVQEYRTQLNGVIMRLHGKFFQQYQTPFSGTPSTVVNQSQSQQQFHITMVLEIQGLIDKKLYMEKLDEKEKTFFKKVKSALPTIKNSVELINLILTTAKNLGIDINQATKMFGF